MFKTILLCAACAAAPSLSAADQWVGQDGQGVRIAAIQHDGIYLGVNCATAASGLTSSVTVAHQGRKPTGTIRFIFDYDESSLVQLPFVAGTYKAGTEASRQKFSALVRSLRAGRWVEVIDTQGGNPLVPLKGSGNALIGCE
ncbi:hypothetical protein [Yoonia sediminilitoris]|uniref:Uncharacterized protein n=1 Tax=Yoonia sediminilitoris TaxID=1286148 RepID=A0A2T6K9R1_9RHOB|nr:hypothetical protein [Yoonia sediminilitoris]PUB11566.1 hypothetical protein C8N45_11384 [Yoonia sediminilitoris]RCW91766.1 hypothetical protein DFP92_11384 [Yoonia sediminilitoris]